MSAWKKAVMEESFLRKPAKSPNRKRLPRKKAASSLNAGISTLKAIPCAVLGPN